MGQYILYSWKLRKQWSLSCFITPQPSLFLVTPGKLPAGDTRAGFCKAKWNEGYCKGKKKHMPDTERACLDSMSDVKKILRT